MENKVEKRRDLSFDIAKGIAIFLVVWGHVLQQGIGSAVEDHGVFRIIYSVHMPLFAMISGYFFYVSSKKRSLVEVVTPKAKSYIKLIFIWNSVHYIFELILHGREQFSMGTFFREWLSELVYGYWFLWAMLFYSVLSAFVVKRLEEKYWFWGFIGVMVLSMLSPCRWVIISLYPFFVFGLIVAHKNALEIFREKKIIGIASIVCVIGLIVYFTMDYITNAQIKVVLDVFVGCLGGNSLYSLLGYECVRLIIYYLLGVAGSIWFLGLSKWLAEHCVHQRITKALCLLGGESLAIYILQRIIVEQLCPGIYDIIAQRWSLERYCLSSDVVGGIVSFVISCIFVFVIYWMIKGVKRFRVGNVVLSNK